MKLYKFIGKNGSLGLKKGKHYYIKLKKHLFSKKILAYIKIENIVLTCPYSNIDTFFKNWEEV